MLERHFVFVSQDTKHYNWAGRIVSSALFSNGIQMLIMTNLIVLGIEVDISARLSPGEEPGVFEAGSLNKSI